jgi:hypothetical protein
MDLISNIYGGIIVLILGIIGGLIGQNVHFPGGKK